MRGVKFVSATTREEIDIGGSNGKHGTAQCAGRLPAVPLTDGIGLIGKTLPIAGKYAITQFIRNVTRPLPAVKTNKIT